MVIIAGCVIVRDNKILMVKEAKKKCYGQWNFPADIVEENIKFDSEEILDVQWLDIKDVKSMTDQELRGYDTSIQFIKDYEANKIYPLEIFNNMKYIR